MTKEPSNDNKPANEECLKNHRDNQLNFWSKNLETTSLFSRRERGHFCKCSLKLKRHEPMFIYCPLGLIFQTTLLTTVPWTSSSPVSELQRTRCKGRLKDVPACENMTTIVELKINKATRFNWFTSDGRQPWPLTAGFLCWPTKWRTHHKLIGF